MIEYLDILDSIKEVKLDAISYFNDKVNMPLVLSSLNSLIKSDDKSIFIEKNSKLVELNEIDRNAYFEIISILKKLKSEYYTKIEFKYIDFFEKFKLNIESFEEFELKNLSEETLKILAILNLKYWCANDEERKKLLEEMEPKKIQKEEENINTEIKEIVEENKELTKTTWWTRILNKIRMFKDRRK